MDFFNPLKVQTLKYTKWILHFFIGLGIILPFLAANGTASQAAPQADGWSPQQRIPDYGNESRPPYLVADHGRTVYAFNTQPDGENLQAIFYRQWSLVQGWSPPVDILLSPLAGAPLIQGAYLDQSDNINLIFFAGNELYGAIYYTRAPAYLADQAGAWSKPVIVGDNALGIGNALAGDDHGDLFVVFSGKEDGIGLYSVISNDGGNTWSTPAPVYIIPENGLVPNGTELAVDSQDHLHAVWSVVDQAGIDQAIYYAHLSSFPADWSQAQMLAKRDAGDYKAAWPSIISYNGQLMVIYQDSNPATRWMRRSFDNGQTWSDPVRPWPHVGEYSQADLLIDSNNTLHIILGNRNGECCHGMWHATWLGDSWSALEPIVMGPKTLAFDPSAPRSIVSQGNIILATWWTDTGGGPRNGAWYSYIKLDTPELPVKPLLEPSLSELPQTTPTFTGTLSTITPGIPTPSQTPVSNQFGADFVRRPPSYNPSRPVIMAIIPIVILIAGAFWYRKLNS